MFASLEKMRMRLDNTVLMDVNGNAVLVRVLDSMDMVHTKSIRKGGKVVTLPLTDLKVECPPTGLTMDYAQKCAVVVKRRPARQYQIGHAVGNISVRTLDGEKCIVHANLITGPAMRELLENSYPNKDTVLRMLNSGFSSVAISRTEAIAYQEEYKRYFLYSNGCVTKTSKDFEECWTAQSQH